MPWRPAFVAAAAGAALVPLPAAIVERLYSTRLYLGIQPLLTSLSNLAPFALFDGLVLVAAVSWIALSTRDVRSVKGRLRALAVIAWRAIVWSAALYLVFLFTWGLNYRRVRLVDALALDPARITALAVKDASFVTAGRLNALHDRGHAGG